MDVSSPLRVAYIVTHDLDRTGGVTRKIGAQMRAWRELGIRSCLFAASPDCTGSPSLRDLAVETFSGEGGRSGRVGRLCRAVAEWRPDLIYLRFGAYYRSLARLIRTVPTVLELNSNDLEEYRRTLSLPRYVHHRVFRGRIIRAADAGVAVTSEIGRCYDLPTTVIANGIRLADYEILPPVNAGPLRGVFIGSSGRAWHGVDKLAEAARNLDHWRFDVIGYEGHPGVGKLPNLTWHGALDRSAYEAVMARADVAFGSLGLHRIGLDIACPLKVREYLAFGLPVVLGYSDEDFPAPEEFLLQLPNRKDNVVSHLTEIDEFAGSWRGRRVPRSAVERIDLEVKERKRVELFHSVVSEGRASTGSGGPDR